MAFQNVLLAPNAFKETFSPSAMAQLMEEAFSPFLPDAIFTKKPIADGGDGSLDAIRQGTESAIQEVKVITPYGKERIATYLSLPEKTAFIEMALASGLTLTRQEERDSKIATSYGLGQLIKEAIVTGHTTIYVGIGGSATNDGGIGMAKALGTRFLDKEGDDIVPLQGKHLAAEDMQNVSGIDTTATEALITGRRIIIASDVDNPLLGPNGATAVYGPQKGASEEDLAHLEQWMGQYADVVEQHVASRFRDTPGAGAAGGVGFGLMAFCRATAQSGFDIIAKLTDLEAHVKEADLIITGEGRIDAQSGMGKGLSALAKLTSEEQTIIAIGGTNGVGYEALFSQGIDCLGFLCSPNVHFDPQEVRAATPALLKRLAEKMGPALQEGKQALQGKTFLAEEKDG